MITASLSFFLLQIKISNIYIQKSGLYGLILKVSHFFLVYWSCHVKEKKKMNYCVYIWKLRFYSLQALLGNVHAGIRKRVELWRGY